MAEIKLNQQFIISDRYLEDTHRTAILAIARCMFAHSDSIIRPTKPPSRISIKSSSFSMTRSV
jgi:hypothetical protein